MATTITAAVQAHVTETGNTIDPIDLDCHSILPSDIIDTIVVPSSSIKAIMAGETAINALVETSIPEELWRDLNGLRARIYDQTDWEINIDGTHVSRWLALNPALSPADLEAVLTAAGAQDIIDAINAEYDLVA